MVEACSGEASAGGAAAPAQRLIGSVSASDFRGFTAESSADLLMPLGEFLAKRHGCARDALPLVSLPPSSSLRTVLQALVSNKVHRVYLTCQKTGAALGVVTPTDILRLLVIGFAWAPETEGGRGETTTTGPGGEIVKATAE